jgi:hypothetical protein
MLPRPRLPQVPARTATEQTTTRPEAGWSPPSKDATQATIALSPDRDSTKYERRMAGSTVAVTSGRLHAPSSRPFPEVVPASAGARSEPDPLPHPPERRTALVPGCSAQFHATRHCDFSGAHARTTAAFRTGTSTSRAENETTAADEMQASAGVTTSSACLLHGLLPASPRGPRDLRQARRPASYRGGEGSTDAPACRAKGT